MRYSATGYDDFEDDKWMENSGSYFTEPVSSLDFHNIKDFSPECSFYQKLDRVLSSEMEISVGNVALPHSIGGSELSKRNIYLDFHAIRKISNDYISFVKHVKSVNHHELAHMMFTIKRMVDTFKDRNKFHLFNMLEDGRVDTLFVDKYPISRPYFIRLLMNYVLENSLKDSAPSRDRFCSLASGYILAYGRRYVSPSVIAKIRQRLEKNMDAKKFPEISHLFFDIKEVEDIIDSFTLAHRWEKQKELTQKLWLIVGKLFTRAPLPQMSSVATVYYRAGQQKRKSEKISKECEQRNKELKKKIEKFKKSIDESSKNFEVQKNNQVKDKPKEVSELDKSDEADNEDNEGNNLMSSINGELGEADEILEIEVESDIEQISGIRAGKEEVLISGSEPYIIKESDKIMSKRLQTLIKKLRNDLTQSYVTKLKSGSLDMRRVIQTSHTPDNKVFKKFRHNKINKTKTGAVILVDSSGSMRMKDYETALRSAYCLSDCLEKTGSKSMVLSFSVHFKVLKKFNEKSSLMKLDRAYGGGTTPEPALVFSEKELGLIKKQLGIRNLLVFMITDCAFETNSLKGIGDYSGNKNSMKNIFKRMKGNIVSVVIQFKPSWAGSRTDIENEDLNCLVDYSFLINSFDELHKRVGSFIRHYETKIHREAV